MLVVREGDLTCRQFTEWLKRTHSLDLSMLTAGKFILYNPSLFKSHREERAGQTISAVWRHASKAEIPPGRRFLLLELSSEDSNGDVVVPQIKYFFA